MPPTLTELGLPHDPSENHREYVHRVIDHLLNLNDTLTPASFCKATWRSEYVNLGTCNHWCYRGPKHQAPCICPCGSSSGVLPVTLSDRIDHP